MGVPSNALGYASLIGQIGGLATSAIGASSSASSQKINLQSQANIADTNARIAELGAQSALLQGQQETRSLTMRAGQLKSKQRAALAANGVDLGEGSAAETLASTDVLKEADMATINANAVRTAWGYRTQALNFKTEGESKRIAADAISPGSSAFSTLLGGAGKVASSWYSLSSSNTTAKSADPLYDYGAPRGWWG